MAVTWVAVVFIPVVLIFCCLCVWGLVALVRKCGASGLVMTLVIGLPLLAVAMMLLSLFAVKSSRHVVTQTARVEMMPRVSPPRTAPRPRQQIVDQAIAQADELAEESRTQPYEVATEYESAFASSESHAEFALSEPAQAPVGNAKLRLNWSFLVVIAMLGVAVLIGVSVFLAGLGGSLRLRDVGAKLASVIWVVPAIVVVAFPLWKSGLLLTQATIRPGVEAVVMSKPVQNDTGEVSAASTDAANAKTPEPKVPEWVTQTPHRVGKTQFLVIKSGYNAALNESERQEAISRGESQLFPVASVRVRNYISEVYPIPADWRLQDRLVRDSYAKTFLEVKDQEFGKVYRTHVQLKLSPQLREQFYPHWKKKNAESRLFALGTVLAVITLLLGTTATYLRLDRMTAGAYRGRLKLASLSFITAGVLAVGLVLA